MARKIRSRRNDKNFEEDDEEEGLMTLNLSNDARRTIAAVFLFVLALFFILGFFDLGGFLGGKLALIAGLIFGWGKFIAPIIFILIAGVLLRKKPTVFYVTKIIGLVIIFISILGLFHLLPFDADQFKAMANEGVGGGYVGYAFAQLFNALAGKFAGTIILLVLLFVGAVVAFNISLVGVTDRVSHVDTDALRNIKKPNINLNIPFFKRKEKKSSDDDDEYYEDENEDEYENEETDNEENLEDQEEFIEEASNDEQEDTTEEDDLDESDFDEDGFDDEGFDDQDAGKDSREDGTHEQGEGEGAEEFDTEPDGEESGTSGTVAKEAIVDSPQEWELPSLDLLARSSGSAKGGDTEKSAQIIKETLAHFGIDVELENITTGPTVTQYAFRPPSGVKLSKITALSADLALALAAHPIRIEAPIPGKSLIGVEVPNKSTTTVRLRDVFGSQVYKQNTKKLTLALGEDVGGNYIVPDLAKMPHLLVAGATGAGKSVTVNSIILSLLYQNTPDELKMILVDPKRVELSLYNGIPHLLADVIVDNGKVLNALKWSIGEMERRYKSLQQTGARDIDSYNEKRLAGNTYVSIDEDTGEKKEEDMENLPIIVIVIDELADLMASHGKEVEGAIVRLAQMSRAVGIHLIVSTQRPSVEVITGTIKANLPTRIALRVATQIDSRTIIDAAGAEKLLGNGDMLYVGASTASAKRLQGVFVEEAEVKSVVDFIKKQAKGRDEEIGEDITATTGGMSAGSSDSNGNNDADDELYEDAKNIVVESGKASTSFLQRRLRIGYSRAARLIDILEEQGIVGAADGAKPREVLLGKESSQSNEPGYDDPDADQAKREKWEG